MFRKQFLFVLVFCFLTSILYAQFSSLPSNMSNIRSSDVSEDQVAQIITYMRQNNVSTQQAYDLLLARGMSTSEAALLRSK